ncbi:hypothetical protein [Ureibacillus aquaedulcis]|uniref:DUF4365 domain-containing protein n=1 Tax=Ureibacillus aquaedulcis TaxID=3058421 RepID=A0ABT8GNT5_9BACL|nr:hypothetical protein [Ureibacillus sp. BA0131]MDN4493083.1 hypothetical protein [Ureibacillus sp. BA0131]
MVNMDDLYFGLGYENHAKGQFMRLGFEAFKMEADFGFDLLVSSQAKKTFKNIIAGEFSVFQVKAGRVHNWHITKARAGDRKIGEASFYLSEEHLENLIKEPKAFILCYIVDGSDHDNVVGYFWLNNSHIKYLYEGRNTKYKTSTWTWFHKNNRGYLYLKAKITLEAKLNEQYQEALESLEGNINKYMEKNSNEHKEFTDILDKFKRLISKSDITNNNSNSRIELIASTENSGEFGSKLILCQEVLQLSQFEIFNLPHPFFPR